MSHVLFSNAMLSNSQVWSWLEEVDRAEAERCRQSGCRHCGGTLHISTFPRKPYRLALPLWGEDAPRRFSFCCSECRRRETPASVRFFGRRFYVGALFLVASALALRGGVRLSTISRKWKIPMMTLRRWRQWWREAFETTPGWRDKQGDLVMEPGADPLCVVLRRMAGARFAERLLRSLVWFKPWTGRCTLAAGTEDPAENVSVAIG